MLNELQPWLPQSAEAEAGYTPQTTGERPRVQGKFLFVGDRKLYLRGVTYGPFRPGEQGCEYHNRQTVDEDFARMSRMGFNSVRTYTVPPAWLLDSALAHGLRVMVGLPWEQHLTFLDDRKRSLKIEQRVRAGVRACAGHPALLCYTIGNEIPASIVRWHGKAAIERFLHRLYSAVKSEDPGCLATYVNFPSTEYLSLPFLDFISFNVYLESRERLAGYLERLEHLAGHLPLVMAEIGLDSKRNGLEKQANVLDWQIQTAFATGCAGAMVFSWTDEWYRGGFEIEDWDFGLTTRNREPKPALFAVARAFKSAPVMNMPRWPSISVVVCTYNGQRTIGETLTRLREVLYPDFEVIVVDDGSTDDTAAIASEFPECRLIRTPNEGLSRARNIGMKAAGGEIVAYLDDDAYPDPEWLQYLACAFVNGDHAAVGGPNLPPPGDGFIAECVANAPGGPTHVMLTDRVAEHIPGCNFAVRKERLEAIGGFDVNYRIAGDDVDVCWRLQERGWTIGFHPAALVWHHRRNSVKAYWKQQKNYGKAEALLERKWPAKYNAAGHVNWSGRLYGPGALQRIGSPWRIYYGTWGSALFQSVYESRLSLAEELMQMPEWYAATVLISALALGGIVWRPLLMLAPIAAAAALPLLIAVIRSAMRAVYPSRPASAMERFRLRALTALLFLMQPLARWWGRHATGLALWRNRLHSAYAWPRRATFAIWSENWAAGEDWLARLESELNRLRSFPIRGGDFERWDLRVDGGVLGSIELMTALEEHGAGKQLLRCKSKVRVNRPALGVVLILAVVAAIAGLRGEPTAAYCLATVATLLAVWIARDCAAAQGCLERAINALSSRAADKFPVAAG